MPPADLNKMRAGIAAKLYGEIERSTLMLSGGYENAGASTRLRTNSGRARGGSADSHRDFYTRDSLRRQCQHADRNNVLARGLVQRLIDMVVGDGFSLLAKTEDPEWNKAASWLFARAAGEPDCSVPPKLLKGVDLWSVPKLDIRNRTSLTEQAAESVRSACFDGDRGLVLTNLGQYQEVEAERIRNPENKPDGDGLIGGVAMNAAGTPLAYHIATYDRGQVTSGKTVAVGADDFLFLANPIRKITGSTRGEPQMQAALSRLEHLEKFEQSSRVAAHIQACLAALITVENPAADVLTSAGETDEDSDGNERRKEKIQPGTLKRLRPGESVSTINPSQPGPNYTDFVLMQVLMICSDLGLPLPLALLDARQVNLSSIRSVMQFAWRNFERWQDWLKRELYTPVYTWRTAMFIRQGLLPYRDDWMAHEFVAPPPPVMDPKVEIDAARSAIDGLLVSRTRMQQRLFGFDGDAESIEIARVQDNDEALGIEATAAPGSGPSGFGAADKPTDNPTDKPTDKPGA